MFIHIRIEITLTCARAKVCVKNEYFPTKSSKHVCVCVYVSARASALVDNNVYIHTTFILSVGSHRVCVVALGRIQQKSV